MTSHATLEDLSGFLDAELSGERRREVAEHVRGCTACRDRLAGLQSVVNALDRLREQTPPQHLERVVAQGVEHLRQRRSLGQRLEARARRFNTHASLLPFFGVVLALGMIIYLLSFALAREERGTTRLILGQGRIAAEVPVPGERREVAERVFQWSGELWVERGTEEAAPARALSAEALAADPALAELGERLAVLDGRVRFRYGGQVLELAAGAAAARPARPAR